MSIGVVNLYEGKYFEDIKQRLSFVVMKEIGNYFSEKPK